MLVVTVKGDDPPRSWLAERGSVIRSAPLLRYVWAMQETEKGAGEAPATSARHRGWYLAAEVGQLVGVSGETIGQWARHRYILSSRSTGRPRIYSFQDVAEAMVVRELLDAHPPYKDIRRIIACCIEEYGDWPLTSAPLAITQLGNKEAVLLRKDALLLDLAHATGEQTWIPSLTHLREIAGLLKRGGWVIRDRQDITRIEVNPDRLSGRPTIRNRRVPVETVAELAGTSNGLHILRADYRLSRKEISDAQRWYSAVSSLGVAA